MRITILRHASASHKGTFPGPDDARPLDDEGVRDAVGLVPILARHSVDRLLSSPAVRCIQSLTPFAELVGHPIELWDGLGPDADSSRLLECIGDPAFDRAVLCTHGDVMRPLLGLGAFRSLMRDTGIDRHALLAKGRGWRLRLTPKGKIVGFEHLVPAAAAPPRRRSK